tara:strand:+ start:171 stop:551 length:381 start_codon:yes stop_codon:yes gene_type:complete
MVKRGLYRKSRIDSEGRITREKATYLPKDNKMVRTLKILSQFDKLNQTKLMSTNGLKRGQWQKYNNILSTMVEWNWLTIEKSMEHEKVNLYGLTDKGRQLASDINKLISENPELEKLETFQPIDVD